MLLELERGGPQRPSDLQARLLFAHYNLSRLLDGMATADAVAREVCPDDHRGQLVSITVQGRGLRRRMWLRYGPAIAAAVGARVTEDEAARLAVLLRRLAEAARDAARPSSDDHIRTLRGAGGSAAHLDRLKRFN